MDSPTIAMRGRRRQLLMAIVLSCVAFGARAVEPEWDVEAFTEEWPPLNYTVDGASRGISVEILELACQRLGWRCRITVASWARAVLEARSRKNGLVFTMARMADLELEFQWAGPIMPREVWLF